MKKHIATLILLVGVFFGFAWKYGNEPSLIATVLLYVVFAGLLDAGILLETLVLVNYYFNNNSEKKIILRCKDLKTYMEIEPDEYAIERSWVVFSLVRYMNTFYIYFPSIFGYIEALSLGKDKNKADRYMAEYLGYVQSAVQRKIEVADAEVAKAQAELDRVNTNLSSTLKNRTNQELKGR